MVLHPLNNHNILHLGHNCHPLNSLISNTITHLTKAVPWYPLVHRGGPPDQGCCLWEYKIVVCSISCHNCCKARNRCHDYFKTATPPHLKAINLKLNIWILLTTATSPALWTYAPQANDVYSSSTALMVSLAPLPD